MIVVPASLQAGVAQALVPAVLGTPAQPPSSGALVHAEVAQALSPAATRHRFAGVAWLLEPALAEALANAGGIR